MSDKLTECRAGKKRLSERVAEMEAEMARRDVAMIVTAQRAADSYTLRREDAAWVVAQARAQFAEDPNLSVSRLAGDLHQELWHRRGWFPSAREVFAICEATLAFRAVEVSA